MTISEQEIDRLVQAGELIPLLCAVAELTNDRSVIADEFRPNLDPLSVAIPENGGVAPAAAAEAFARAAEALKVHFNARGGSDASALGPLPTSEIVEFMTDGDPAYRDLMRHELDGEADVAWTKADLDPGRDFVVGIVGAGQAGLAMARELKRAGVDFVVFEAAGSVGGTWRWNAYPGCRLDTSTLAYSYSFSQKNDWKNHFEVRESIEQYYQDFADDEDLMKTIQLNTKVVSAVWDDAAQWDLTLQDTQTGATDRVQVHALVSAVGYLNQVKIPDFPGLADYRGEVVHSAQWHPQVDYHGKRVNVVGTGASAYQVAPAIVDEVESLTIFQRSAPWMLPAPLYHEAVGEDRLSLMRQVPGYHRWLRLWEFWHSTIGKYELTRADPEWKSPDSLSEGNQRFREALVANVSRQYVGHEELLEFVIPTYPVGAKRMLRDNGVWARTVQQPRTTLTMSPIVSFDRDGILTEDGKHHPADLTIFATGFHGTQHLGTMDVRGRRGLSLRDFWGDESRAHNGVAVPGFPNLFCLAGPNTGLVAVGSQTFMTECSINYAVALIRHLFEIGANSIEPTETAYRGYIDWVEDGNRSMAWGASGERSWYRNERGTNTVVWPYSLLTYYELTREVDSNEVVVAGRAESGATEWSSR